MESFKTFFKSPSNTSRKSNKPVTPHHTTDKRVADRGLGFRNGQEQGLNFKADRWKIGTHNYDQNANQHTGPISDDIAKKLAEKHNIDLNHLPARLGKRPFKLCGIQGNYSIDDCSDDELSSDKGGL
jgi:hypothetical protein